MIDYSRNKTRRSLFIVVMVMLLSNFLMAAPAVEEIYLTDTIPSPPDVPGIVSGPTQACQGETTVYSADIPIGCETQWFIDGILQTTSADTLEVYWYESGIFIISLELTCDTTGNTTSFLSVSVNEWPLVELGNDTTILAGQSLVLDAGNPGCSYLWSTGEITQVITVSTTGNYQVEVSNACGSVEDSLFVDVVVGMNETSVDEINIRISGDHVIINPAGVQIEQIEIWDMAGGLLTRLPFKPVYYLPAKGTFLIRAITYDHRVFGTLVIK